MKTITINKFRLWFLSNWGNWVLLWSQLHCHERFSCCMGYLLTSKKSVLTQNKYVDHWMITNLTCSSTRPQRSRLRRRVDPSEHRHPLCGSSVEVVVVGNGGDPEAGVVLRRGVGPIAIARMVGEAGLPVVGEFRCFFILTLDTAHSLLSAGGERRRRNRISEIAAKRRFPLGKILTLFH